MVEAAYEAGNLAGWRSVIVIGTMLLLPVFLSSWYQPTIPCDYNAVRWFVPSCHKNGKGHAHIPTTRMVNNGRCPRSDSYIMVGLS
jgi:hypothetical protein